MDQGRGSGVGHEGLSQARSAKRGAPRSGAERREARGARSAKPRSEAERAERA